MQGTGMGPSNQPDDDGIIRINRLEPGHVDVVLGSHPGKSVPRPPRAPQPYGLIILCALLAVLSLCLMVSQYRRHAPQIQPVAVPHPAPTQPLQESPPTAENTAPAPQLTQQ